VFNIFAYLKPYTGGVPVAPLPSMGKWVHGPDQGGRSHHSDKWYVAFQATNHQWGEQLAKADEPTDRESPALAAGSYLSVTSRKCSSS
jgi:hypothetical protein